ncbi:hypothetical protein C7271_18560 [filamentous cyanobacterium CCP5]|nr:hypothetical protein C7271_18560 [filamentous cyanobacterium CCP5]
MNKRDRVIKLGTLALVLLGITGLSPDFATACSCEAATSPQAAFDQADWVVAGQVTALDNTPDGLTVELVVQEVWKGTAAAEMMFTTAESSAACGYPFEPGATYLVYLYDGADLPTTHLCSPTSRLEEASDTLEFLGAGGPVGAATQPSSEDHPPKQSIGVGGCARFINQR